MLASFKAVVRSDKIYIKDDRFTKINLMLHIADAVFLYKFSQNRKSFTYIYQKTNKKSYILQRTVGPSSHLQLNKNVIRACIIYA